MPKLPRCCSNRGHPARVDHVRRRTGLSDQAGARDHSVPAGRHQRHRRPLDRHAAQQPPGQAVHRRQPRRRRRRRRHRTRRQRAEGRLHAADRLAGEHGQSLALQAAPTSRSNPLRRSRSWPPRRTCWSSIPGCRRRRSNEFIALAKEKPGKVQYASGGVGSFMHLGGELFKLAAGVDLLHVPFRGGGPAMIDVIGGHTKAAFATMPTLNAASSAGKVRALGVGAQNARRRCRTSPPPTKPDYPATSRQLGRHRGAGRHAVGHRRQAEQGDRGDHEIAGGAEATRDQGAGDRAHELGRVRRLHGEGNGPMGRVVKEGGIKAE